LGPTQGIVSKPTINLLEAFFERLKYFRRVQIWVVVAICCCVSLNGFSQLVYLTDTRSVSGFANFQNPVAFPPLYVTSYTPFSGSATPSAPFADFQGSASGMATLVEVISNSTTGQLTPYSTETARVDATQTSFLHSQELYYTSRELGGSPSGNTGFDAQGNSSLQVTFQVSSPVAYNLTVNNTGDAIATGNNFTLSSSSQGTLATEPTPSYLEVWNQPVYYSGTFTPGDTYTLTITSGGGNAGAYYNFDGGGFDFDLVVPEPSMTALAGLAFLIFVKKRFEP
jgi:hypothetical protein